MARIPCDNLTCPSQIQVTAHSRPLGIAKWKPITLAETAPVKRSRRRTPTSGIHRHQLDLENQSRTCRHAAAAHRAVAERGRDKKLRFAARF